jgi:hypothetical protein
MRSLGANRSILIRIINLVQTPTEISYKMTERVGSRYLFDCINIFIIVNVRPLSPLAVWS